MSRREEFQRGTRPTPFGHVMVATDFSRGAAWAIARAGRLPLKSGGRVTILHVLPEGLPAEVAATAEATARRELAKATRAIERIAAAGHGRVRVAAELGRGRAFVEIARRAHAGGADLLVVGRHGQRPVRDLFIGSTAERVIRVADLPVLVVSAQPRHAYRRPLVASDLGDASRTIVTAALRLLGPEVRSASLIHAYAVPFEGFIMAGASRGQVAELREGSRKAATAELAALETELSQLGLHWKSRVVRGDPRTVILSEALLRRADLVAVGTHGRGGLARALIGSVADWVIRAAACDVFVARPTRPSTERA